ncbi:(2Fe-2S)-binding protein [Nocardiopsis coralliicola]
MGRSRGGSAAAALTDAASLGGFFSAVPAEAGTGRPVEALWSRAELVPRIAATRRAFAERAGVGVARVEPRVAASVLFQSVAARLLSPAVATAALHGAVPDPAALRWADPAGGPLQLLVAGGPGDVAHGRGPRAVGAAVARFYVAGLLAPASTAFRAAAPVSPTVLRGNAASSVAAAAEMVARQRPEAAGAAEAVARAVLADADLADAIDWHAPLSASPPTPYQRRSCCLYYRLPGMGTCGDCVLR